MKTQTLQIEQLETERLILIPFTTAMCRRFMVDDFSDLTKRGFKKGKSWPDDDVMETLPRIINNLLKVETPTGFESWMIIKNDTLEVIGDAGFKGYNDAGGNIDIGYGIIKEERRKGYAAEAVQALIGWAFSNDIVKEITAQCLVSNISSVNLLKKFNFLETKQENDMVYWSLQADNDA